ncbi:MAG TPA: hypothetical protein VKI44_19275 [Acetobacteraceae bacterium]|nr:hypothetical protein [Acetobacteraceae bacterium]
MRAALRIGVTVLVLAAPAGPAWAEMSVYYHIGSWDAFSGPGTDGNMVCGIGSTNPVDNHSISLRFAIGGDSVLFEAKKPNWSIPGGTQLPVVLQIGLDTPWNLQGVGNGQMVEWSLDRTTMETFDAQFRRAGSMTVSFPTGNEPPWTIGLNGSTAISNAFGRCVTQLAQRAGAQPSAPAPSGPTQPFGQAPVQQQEPTLPTTPR